jgi:hypothetical protein
MKPLEPFCRSYYEWHRILDLDSSPVPPGIYQTSCKSECQFLGSLFFCKGLKIINVVYKLVEDGNASNNHFTLSHQFTFPLLVYGDASSYESLHYFCRFRIVFPERCLNSDNLLKNLDVVVFTCHFLEMKFGSKSQRTYAFYIVAVQIGEAWHCEAFMLLHNSDWIFTMFVMWMIYEIIHEMRRVIL